MSAETITLDPSEVASGRTALDVNSGAIRVAADGVDWGDAEIAAYQSSGGRVGANTVDYTMPNRSITIPLRIRTDGTVSFNQARLNLQNKVALIQREGGWLKRVLSDNSGTFYADVVNATLHLPGGWQQAHNDQEPDASLVLEAIPDFYGAERTSSTESGTGELTFDLTGIDGDMPARVRIAVTDTSGNDQRGLIWGIRSRHYSSATTAAVGYEAEALEPLDTATKPALSGAFGGTVVRHSNLSAIWTPVLSTNKGGTAYLTHTGTNRVWARVYSTSGTTVQLRMVWDVGDLVNPVENAPYRMVGGSAYYMADLGEVRLDPSPIGSHRWQGVIQAQGDAGGESVSIDKVWIVPADEGYGALRAPESFSTAGPVARDEFNQTAGTLTGKTAPVGGSWTGTAGTAGDFTLNTTDHWVERTVVNDPNLYTGGRKERLGTGTYAGVQLDLDVFLAQKATGGDILGGVMARYVDANNYAVAGLERQGRNLYFALFNVVAGNVTTHGDLLDSSTGWHSIRAIYRASGDVTLWVGPQGAPTSGKSYTATSSDLATGGALASGGVGIYDACTETSGTKNRYYDNFSVLDLSSANALSDAVVFANQTAELRSDGIYREDTGGTAYGPVSWVTGDLPRLPPSGIEARTTELFVKPTRGDLEELPDSAKDGVEAVVTYSPSWLFVPES